MKTYIAVATQQSTPNSGANNNSNEMPVIGLGGAGVVISLVSILIGKWMPWGEIAKQFAGVRTSKVLQAENRKGQALSRASESQVQATEDLIKATTHNSEALKALKETIASIPKETASVIEVYAAEFRVALDLLDDRLDRIEKNQKLFSVQVKEEFSSAFLELRRALKAKEG